MKTKDENLIKEAISILRDNGSVKYAQKVASDKLIKSWNELENYLPKSSHVKDLKQLCEYLVDREL